MKIISFSSPSHLNLGKSFVLDGKLFLEIPKALNFPHLTITRIGANELAIEMDSMQYLGDGLINGNNLKEIKCDTCDLIDVLKKLEPVNVHRRLSFKNGMTGLFLDYTELINELEEIEMEERNFDFMINRK